MRCRCAEEPAEEGAALPLGDGACHARKPEARIEGIDAFVDRDEPERCDEAWYDEPVLRNERREDLAEDLLEQLVGKVEEGNGAKRGFCGRAAGLSMAK